MTEAGAAAFRRLRISSPSQADALGGDLALEPWAWAALIVLASAPLQVITDAGGRPGAFLLTAAAAALGGAWVLATARWEALRLARAAAPFLLWVVLAGGLSLFGETPRWSLVRWLVWTPGVALAFFAAARLRPGELATAILAALAVMTDASLLTRFWGGLPIATGPGGGWGGLYWGKNELGHVAGVAAPLLTVFGGRALRSRLLWVGSAAAAWACVALAASAGGWLIALALLAGCLALLVASGLARIVLLCGLGLAAGVILAVGDLQALFQAIGKDQTLTGRTAIWRFGLEAAADRPLLGAGFDATGAPSLAQRLQAQFGVYGMHNGYLDALINFGVLGSLAAAATAARAIACAFRGAEDEAAVQLRDQCLALLAGGLVSAISESAATHPSGPIQLLALLAVFGLHRAGLANRPAEAAPRSAALPIRRARRGRDDGAGRGSAAAPRA